MIYSLRGTLLASDTNSVVIECAGVGYRCFVSLQTLGKMPEKGKQAFLFTYMNVREDLVELFGFAEQQELDSFKLLTSVNGVGARLALALLSDFSATQLALAVAAGDTKTLTRSAGVGNKLAQRIVLELKDKLGAFGASDSAALESVSAISSGDSSKSAAAAALVSLGYGQSEAALAVSEYDDSTDVEELIKKALKKLARF